MSPQPDRSSPSELRQEALRAARGLSQGDEALVAVLRDLERERGRATESVRVVVAALAATLQARDGYTGEHADAVHDLAVAVGARLGLDDEEMSELAVVALLHDVGKIGIPDGLLHKPGPLDEAEWALMREHPVIGERILAAVPGLESIARAVRHEHERWDGGGYPDGLAGDAIPLASRIVLACDTWHALISDRPYRRALEHDVALAELRRGAGSQFDPAVAATLLDEILAPSAPASPLQGGGTIGGVAVNLERELVALIAVASAVAAAHRLDEVLEVAAEEACAAIDASSLSIERWQPDRGILRTLINVGDLAPGEERHPADEIYAVESDRVLRQILEEGGTHACSLDDPDIGPIERDLLVAFGKHASLAVPISFAGETWGQIWATRTVDQPRFRDRDTRFLQAISGQIGAAIGRAEVFSRVSELAHTDGLTGLANRRAFDEAIDLAVLEARRDGRDVALLLCDMDNLKEINDHQGHEAGDEALRTVAAALRRTVGAAEGALVARVGGDEFAVLLHRTDDRHALELAESLMRRLSDSHPRVGVSCGVAMLRSGHGRPADLLRAADAAQYAAKRAGRGRVFLAGPTGAVPARSLSSPIGVLPSRALRDVPTVDLARLLTDALGILDGPLAAAPPAERLGGVLRRIAEATDAAGWTVVYTPLGAEPRALTAGSRPGALSGLGRRTAFLSVTDLLVMRMARPSDSGRPGILIERADRDIPGVLRERLEREALDSLLVVAMPAPSGTWVAELAADARSASLRDVEPVLRVLVPEAVRLAASAAGAAEA